MITDAIFDWAARTPARAAIVQNGRPLSYRAFAANIALARGYFARLGLVGPGVAVVAISDIQDFWIASLALRSLGLTTAALPPGQTLAELAAPGLRCAVVSPAEPRPALEAECAAAGCSILPVSLGGEPPLGLDGLSPRPEPGGHILQTSGTTGAYKKVVMHPSFEVEFMRDRRAILGIDQGSAVAAFDFGGWTGIGYNSPIAAWFAGATAVIDRGRAPHMALLHPGLTHAMAFPELLAAILAAPEAAFPRNETLHLSVTSGALTRAQIEQAKARITPRIFSRVGSTEVNTFANTALDSPDDQKWHRLVPGREVQIVDERDRRVGVGVVGQVRVSTAGGPDGYLDDEEASRAFFRDGFFYPGDLAVMREDGRMALQGRFTEVINYKGYKVTPAPVEQRLCEALGLSGACLVMLPDDGGEDQLHAVFETPAPIDIGTLTRVLNAELAGLAGVRVHFVSALPRNQTGKIVRRAVTAQVAAAQAVGR